VTIERTASILSSELKQYLEIDNETKTISILKDRYTKYAKNAEKYFL